MNSTVAVNPTPTIDPAFAREERRFRRLEVSLPVWISTQEAVDQGFDVWELGYTRDLSIGGAKVIVPAGEEPMWRRSLETGAAFVVRFAGSDSKAHIPARLCRVASDASSGQIALGLAFNYDQAPSACERAIASGLATKRTRRRWQGAFIMSLCAVVVAGVLVRSLSAEAAGHRAEAMKWQKIAKQKQAQLKTLSQPIIVGTKSAGIDRAFQSAELRTQLVQIRSNIARLNDPRNMDAAIEARNLEAKKMGLNLAPAAKGARVQLAMAFPYGYNWPLVVRDLESALGRRVPQVVTFSDWNQPFPDLDARQARALGKTLQVTWEPWHFGNPGAVKLRDVAAGKYDAYIDSWANSARAFGGEIYLRFGHEMNGNWYPWSLSAQGGDSSVYVSAYRRVHERFRKAGASNVRWIWCFNAESVPQAAWNDPRKAYPGDDYVDAVGIDGYNFGDTTAHSRWQSFSQIFGGAYALASQAWPKKPLFISETGCSSTGGDKAAWLRDMDETLRTKFPRVESLTWFEAAKEADWRVLSTLGSAQTARALWKSPYYGRGVD